MHDAPAVSYPAGRSFVAGATMFLAWAAGCAGLVAWRVQAQATPVAFAAAAAVLMAGGIFAWRAWLRSPRGMLSWDGLGWTWAGASAAQPGAPEVALDAQRLMLLRWRGGAGAAQWLWLERRAQPARWDDLRRAVYSRASSP